MYPVINGDVEIVTALLAGGASVNHVTPDKNTPLLLAINHGHVAVVKKLVDAGADLSAVDDTGYIPMTRIMFFEMEEEDDRVEMIEALLRGRPKLNDWDTMGCTPLVLAASIGRERAVEKLLAAGASADFETRRFKVTPLIWACERGHVGVVKRLLDARADVNTIDLRGSSALFAAVMWGHVKLLELLLLAGAQIKHSFNNGYSEPSFVDDRSVYDQINVASDPEATRLKLASAVGDIQIVEKVLATHHDLNEKLLMVASSSLLLAAVGGFADAMALLLRAGASVDQANVKGYTALGIAAKNGHLRSVTTLLDAGAIVDHVCDHGCTPLLVAAGAGKARVVEKRLGAKPNVNKADNDGGTALLCASKRGDIDVVRLLMKAGADVEIENMAGLSVLMGAKANDDDEVVAALRASRGGRP